MGKNGQATAPRAVYASEYSTYPEAKKSSSVDTPKWKCNNGLKWGGSPSPKSTNGGESTICRELQGTTSYKTSE